MIPTNIYVPGDFATINDAVNSPLVPSGSIINVAAGEYNEIITIPSTKTDLTLRGAQAGIDARNRPALLGTESIISPITSPGSGYGIINLSSTDIIIDGFTFDLVVSGPGSASIYASEPGQYPPNTSTVNVIGLKIVNNRILSGQNGILIGSIQANVQPINYLVQNNYFSDIVADNILFSNSNRLMTNAFVSQNLFENTSVSNGTSIRLLRCETSRVDYNIMDNSGGINVGNSSSQVLIQYNYLNITNTFSAINIFNVCTNIQMISNTITAAAGGTGINMNNQNSTITIRESCISGPGATAIVINNYNSNVLIYNNIISNISYGILTISDNASSRNGVISVTACNIVCSEWDIYISPNSINIPNQMYAGTNWWNSVTGPQYRTTMPPGPGINDYNAGVPAITYTPFRTTPNLRVCPPPVFLTKSVQPGEIYIGKPILYNISISIPGSEAFTFNTFSDVLPITGNNWDIKSQYPLDVFTISEPDPPNPQTVSLIDLATTTPGIYTVVVSSTSNTPGQIDNTVSANITYGTTTTTISASATAQIQPCIHRTSIISLADGTTQPIEKLRPGTEIIAADGSIVKIIEAVQCIVTAPDGNCGTCIVFEPNSLGPGIPTARFGVDAGHPIGLPDNYTNNHSLRPAKEFLNGTTIYDRKWDSVTDLFDGHTGRYDIIMPSDSCCAYFANGIIVKSRKNFCEPGYNYL